VSKSVRALLRAVEQAFLEPRVEPPRGYQIRASALPFCGRAYVLSEELKAAGKLDNSETDFGLQCIFQTGHGAHGVTQDWLGRARILWGDWECQGPARKVQGPVPAHLQPIVDLYRARNQCGEKGPRGYFPKEPCVHCGHKTKWTYVEVTLSDDKLGLSAHTDGILPQYEAILEIKTTHEKNHRGLTAPVMKHWVYQASMYARLLEEQEGIRMKRILLVYLDRTRFERKFFVRPVIRDTLDSTRAMVTAAQAKRKLHVLPDRICATRSHADKVGCSLEQLCFSPAAHKTLGWSPP